MIKVTSAEFQRKFGVFRDAAQREPVTVTSHGRESIVLLSAHEYRRLKRRDRQVARVEELGDDFLAALASAQVPADQAHLDEELADWRP